MTFIGYSMIQEKTGARYHAADGLSDTIDSQHTKN